jgi:cold shock CspA family protein
VTGNIKNIVATRNYGFIRADISKLEYFFHKDDFVGHWNDLEIDANANGDVSIPVEFSVVESPKGPRAANVRRLDYPNQAV